MTSSCPTQKKSWLITSFEPFAGRPSNNSNLVLQEIKKIATEKTADLAWNFEFYYEVLPVEYDRCFDVLKERLGHLSKTGVRLEGILSLGEGAEDFKLETQANNLDDVEELPDNAGVKRVGQKIFKDLEKTATIPLRFPFQAFSRIRTSINPGYYICNHLCARAGREFGEDQSAPYFGFIHVPRVGQGGMFTADICATIIVNAFMKL
jgi:pyrrolidone-carboxylate peptidase